MKGAPMRKTLPFTKPLAYGQQFYAFPLGILAQYPQATDWVFSNYLQVVYDCAEGSDVVFSFYLHDFSVSPWLETLKLNRELVEMHPRGILGVVRDALERDFYIYLTINERYVPERLAYEQQVDYAHDPLVFGIDDQKDLFELYGFDRNQIFRSSSISQDDLAIAYYNTGPESFYEVPLTLYRFNSDGRYTFDLGFVGQTVVEYLESFNTSTHFQAETSRWDQVYGMDSYRPLESYLDDYGSGAIEYNIQNLHMLWEHKRMMVARLERCAKLVPEVGDLIAPYRNVERMAYSLRLLMIADAGGESIGNFRDEAIPLLHSIRAADQNILRRFAAALDKARNVDVRLPV